MNNKSKLIFRAASTASINTQRKRISPWKVSEREFYVILMRLNETLKMKQFPFCLHGSRLKWNSTFHSSLQKEVQSISRWAGLNQQSANLAKTGVWAQRREPHEVCMLWTAHHEARRCPTCLASLQTPRGWIPVWGLLWIVLTQRSQPTALTQAWGCCMHGLKALCSLRLSALFFMQGSRAETQEVEIHFFCTPVLISAQFFCPLIFHHWQLLPSAYQGHLSLQLLFPNFPPGNAFPKLLYLFAQD